MKNKLSKIDFPNVKVHRKKINVLHSDRELGYGFLNPRGAKTDADTSVSVKYNTLFEVCEQIEKDSSVDKNSSRGRSREKRIISLTNK